MSGTTTLNEAAEVRTGLNFPWTGQTDEMACNFAFGHLLRNVPPRLAINEKMHAPTIMAAAGAIAGVCAQVSLLADAERVTKARADQKLRELQLKDGRVFLYGDALNEMLYSARDAELARSRVWNMMVTAAMQKGLERDAIPDVAAMFRHVSATFGTAKEGLPSVADNAMPAMPVRDLLKFVGPIAFGALAGEITPTPGATNEVLRANRKSWVAISAQVAGNFLISATRVMPPALCLTIAMESAIYASKLSVNAAPKAPDAAPQA